MDMERVVDKINEVRFVEQKVGYIGDKVRGIYNREKTNFIDIHIEYASYKKATVDLPEEQVGLIILMYIDRLERKALELKKLFEECGLNIPFDKKFGGGIRDVFEEIKGLRRYIDGEIGGYRYGDKNNLD